MNKQSSIIIGPGDPADPLHGLLDNDSNFFYIVSHCEDFINRAAETISQHRSVTPILISDATNWNHTLIDNLVCYNWGLNYTPAKNCINNVVTHSTDTHIIITNLLFFLKVYTKIGHIKSSLPNLSYSYTGTALPNQQLVSQYVNDSWVMASAKREKVIYTSACDTINTVANKIVNIATLNINSALYQSQFYYNLTQIKIPTGLTVFDIFYEL